MRTSWRSLTVSLTALSVPAVLAMGCSSTSPGSPSGSGAGDSSAPAGTSSSTKPSTTRPKSIDLKTVDPCHTLTPQQQQQFNITIFSPGTAGSALDKAKDCVGSDFTDDLSVGLTPVTTRSLDDFAKSFEMEGQRPTQVAGFPAMVWHRPGDTTGCSVSVDVADGQFLDTMVFSPSGKNDLEAYCQKAQQIAGAAITTVSSR